MGPRCPSRCTGPALPRAAFQQDVKARTLFSLSDPYTIVRTTTLLCRANDGVEIFLTHAARSV